MVKGNKQVLLEIPFFDVEYITVASKGVSLSAEVIRVCAEEGIPIYDIVDDKLRTKIANKCKDYGLTRIQYSAFFGEMTTNRREELAMALRKLLGKHWGRIHFFPCVTKICAS